MATLPNRKGAAMTIEEMHSIIADAGFSIEYENPASGGWRYSLINENGECVHCTEWFCNQEQAVAAALRCIERGE